MRVTVRYKIASWDNPCNIRHIQALQAYTGLFSASRLCNKPRAVVPKHATIYQLSLECIFAALRPGCLLDRLKPAPSSNSTYVCFSLRKLGLDPCSYALLVGTFQPIHDMCLKYRFADNAEPADASVGYPGAIHANTIWHKASS
jgi:hypothetical protein